MSSFWDEFMEAVEEFLRLLFAPVESFVETFGDELLQLIVGTPAPNAVFTAPTNDPWAAIYEYYWGAIVPLSLSLYGLMLGIVIFLESTSYLFGSYHRSKLKKRAFSGLLGILSWWWVAALSLRFVDALTGFIVPDLSEIALFETASFAILGVLGVIIAQAVNLTRSFCCSRLSIRFGNSGSIFNQRENPAVHGGRESRPFRDATAASGTAGTPPKTAKSSANVCFDRVTPHPIANERGMWAALHPCLRRAGSPVDGLWPTRCEPCRHRTARFDRLGESGRLKIDRDDTLSDGSARDSATRRSRPRVETRPIDAGRASLETEPDDRVPRCGRKPRRLRRARMSPVRPVDATAHRVLDSRCRAVHTHFSLRSTPGWVLRANPVHDAPSGSSASTRRTARESFSLSLGGVGAWLLALLIPVAALFAPLVMFWQAGALFFFADRASRHASLGRAQQRVSRMRDGSESAAHGGRNFGRGVAGKPAVNRDNQQLLDSSRSRAHSAGSRVNQARNRLKSAFADRGSTASGPDGDDAGGRNASQDARGARSENFEALRDRGGGAIRPHALTAILRATTNHGTSTK